MQPPGTIHEPNCADILEKRLAAGRGQSQDVLLPKGRGCTAPCPSAVTRGQALCLPLSLINSHRGQ